MKISKKIIALIVALVSVLTLVACSSNSGNDSTDNTQEAENSVIENNNSENTKVKVTVKDYGEFIIELYPEYAPKTVENFISLVESGFYSGTVFHRVIDGFMAQGGAGVNDEKLEPIEGEFASNGWTKNTLSHTRGVISMARTSDPNSATSQFFICYDDTGCKGLDGDYAAFGKVIEGMEVVDKFLTAERTYNYSLELAEPVEDIVIEKMEIVK